MCKTLSDVQFCPEMNDSSILAQIAGHSSLKQLEKRYGHVWDKSKKAAAETAGKMFTKSE